MKGIGDLMAGKGIVWVNPEVTRSSEVLSASTLWLYPLLAFSPELQPRVSWISAGKVFTGQGVRSFWLARLGHTYIS